MNHICDENINKLKTSSEEKMLYGKTYFSYSKTSRNCRKLQHIHFDYSKAVEIFGKSFNFKKTSTLLLLVSTQRSSEVLSQVIANMAQPPGGKSSMGSSFGWDTAEPQRRAGRAQVNGSNGEFLESQKNSMPMGDPLISLS